MQPTCIPTIYKSLSILLLFMLSSCNGKENGSVPTTLVKRGTFTEELIEEGSVRSVNSINITAPRISYRYGGMKIVNMVEDGTEVEMGDTLVIFDPTEIKKAIIDIEQKLDIAQAGYDKMIATQRSEIEDLEADLEISRIALEISRINFEQSVHEAEITKKEIQLKLKNAELALQRAGEEIVSRKKIHEVDAFQKQIGINQLKTQLEEANTTMADLFVVSPARGIAIIEENWMTDQKWQVGDQPYSGSKLIELPDLDQMMADVQINEVDALKISRGIQAVITLDAYSDTVYHGEITSIANLAQEKSRNSNIKVFPVGISISGRNDKLMPGLTVSCRLKLKEIPGVLIIPVEAVFKEDPDEYVYVKTASGFKRQKVVIGNFNSDYALVSEGISENDEIALIDPFMNKMEETAKEI